MSIADNIARVHEQIAASCRAANRSRESVRLMAVSKTHPTESILEAHAAGVCLFGENRVQEYAAKQAALTHAGLFSAPMRANIHYIGHLQSNKATQATQLFDAVDSVDSLRLAERLNKAVGEAGKRLPILIEIKLSPEGSKHGLVPDIADDAAELHILLERLPSLSHLQLRGLMTVPPYAEDPEQARPYFRQLRLLRDDLSRTHSNVTLEELSMGMSHDFPVAIQEGATVVRIGTAIFGARPHK